LLAGAGLIAVSGCVTTQTIVGEDPPVQIVPAMADRIATLELMLAGLEDAEPISAN